MGYAHSRSRKRPTRDVERTVAAAFVAAAISNILPGSFFFLTKEVAVCLHSAQVTRREGTWVVVLFEYGTCW